MQLKTDWTPIEPGEIENFGIDFADDLRIAQSVGTATIASAQTWTAVITPDAASTGTDPTPANIISGAAQLQGTISVQRIAGCVDGVVYSLEAQVTLTDGRVMKRFARLPCIARS